MSKLALDRKSLIVLAVFGADYHGGQWSRLYRLQCRARHVLAARGELPVWGGRSCVITDRMYRDARRTKLYRELAASKYATE